VSESNGPDKLPKTKKGRAELARARRGLPGLHFALRARPDVGARHRRYRRVRSDGLRVRPAAAPEAVRGPSFAVP
jgi:hypothetical protein